MVPRMYGFSLPIKSRDKLSNGSGTETIFIWLVWTFPFGEKAGDYAFPGRVQVYTNVAVYVTEIFHYFKFEDILAFFFSLKLLEESANIFESDKQMYERKCEPGGLM